MKYIRKYADNENCIGFDVIKYMLENAHEYPTLELADNRISKFSRSSTIKRVKNWKSGEQILRTAGAGFMEAEKGFRRIKRYRQISFSTNSLYKFTKTEQTDFSEQMA